MFDIGKLGKISFNDLKEVSRKVQLITLCTSFILFFFFVTFLTFQTAFFLPFPKANEYIPDSDLRDMILEADIDGDGLVNLRDFAHIMRRTNLFR